MRLKKILITSSFIALASSPFIVLTFINIFPKPDVKDERYIMKGKATDEQRRILKTALDETIQDEELIFKFYTLTRTNQYTPSMLSWFVEFDKALKALDSRLGFELVPRTNQTVETGFRNKNAEMVSMFWSPDYHNIGTWIGFHFYPNYQVPNLWPSLYNYLTSGVNDGLPSDSTDFGPANSNFNVSRWGASLKRHLEGISYPSATATNKTNLFQPIDKLLQFDKELDRLSPGRYSKVGAREAVANEIALWADQENELAIGLVNWMDHQLSALPWISNGPSTTLNSLVRNGFHTPKNEYSGETFRDWFYKPNIVNGNNFVWWNPTDPFATNKTPYNASFNDASNNMFFQSTYNGLVDWKIVNDWEFDGTNWIPPKHSFFMSGADEIIFYSDDSLKNQIYKLSKSDLSSTNLEIPINNTQYVNALTKAKSIKFVVNNTNPFPWIGSDGQKKGDLKAQDYFWGLMGYYLSTQIGINTNGYYLNLMNLDINKTIDANPTLHNGRNANGNFTYEPKKNNANDFNLVLTNPNINFLDIFSKQYLQPLPIENEKVQNIFKIPSDRSLFDDEGNFLVNRMDFNTLYGSGEIKSNFRDWWSVGPYYVSNVSEQDINFRINQGYFDKLSPANSNIIPFGNLTQNPRIKNVIMKYAGAYSPQVTYEQFKTNEIDKSMIPSAFLSEAYNSFRQDFRTEGVSIVPKTDLIPYNTNVYELETSGFLEPKLDANGNKILKSLVSPQYEKAIVRDFDKGPNGNSWKIRNAIAQSIDWYSLSALANPDTNPSFQQSLIPFGNFRSVSGNLTNIPDFNNSNSYWETAANNSSVGWLRRTLNEYKTNWNNKFKNSGR